MAEAEAVAVYRGLAKIPSVDAGQIHRSGDIITINSSWSQRDLERTSTIKFSRSYMILAEPNKSLKDARVVPVRDASEKHEELLSSFSPCGEYRAVLRKVKNKKGEDQQYLEVWNQKSKVTNVNLTCVDKHGKVYHDAEFGCLNWSSKNDRLVYIAERKQKKTAAFFDRKPSDESEPMKDAPVKGDQFLFRDDWGETMVDKCYPVICTFDIATETVTVLEGLPEEISPAQTSWGPGDNGIVFSALYHEPYKIGAVYCDNRRSAIFHLSLEDNKCSLISSDDDKCCRSPRCSPDGSKVVYLQNDFGGPHKHCKQLMMFDWANQTSSIIIDVVGRADSAESFPGLFVENLPLRCWAGDNMTVYLDTLWRSDQKLISVNTSTKELSVISKSEIYSSWTVVDVSGSLLLARRNTPNKTGQLVICDVSQPSLTGDLEWIVVEDNQQEFSDLSWKLVVLPRSDGLDIEGILLYPAASAGKEEQPPLIVFPHGGPHSSYTTSYYMLPTFFCKLGYIVVLINYRGSTEFGQDYIDSLPGKVGSQDVTDCHVMANHILSDGYGDWDKVIITGGSHGGFLSLHMIGQYPDFYKVCAVRNPVANIAAMVGTSDIPNWCYVEAGLQFSFDSIPSSEIYEQMTERSPMSHLHKVKAPTLFLIGKDDRRVPPKQGEDFYKKLRARGVKTKMLLYPENTHALAKLDAEPDCFINTHKWFQENL